MSDRTRANIALALVVLLGVVNGGALQGCDWDIPSVITPDVEGPLRAVILNETEDSTPAYARLYTALRTGTADAWFAERGHKLDIIDDDLDRPYRALCEQEAGATRPALVILGNGDKDVVATHPVTEETTADNVVEWMRRAGG